MNTYPRRRATLLKLIALLLTVATLPLVLPAAASAAPGPHAARTGPLNGFIVRAVTQQRPLCQRAGEPAKTGVCVRKARQLARAHKQQCAQRPTMGTKRSCALAARTSIRHTMADWRQARRAASPGTPPVTEDAPPQDPVTQWTKVTGCSTQDGSATLTLQVYAAIDGNHYKPLLPDDIQGVFADDGVHGIYSFALQVAVQEDTDQVTASALPLDLYWRDGRITRFDLPIDAQVALSECTD